VTTAARAMHRAAATSQPLPEVGALKPLYGAGFRPRSGQVLMVAGQPGSLKSMFAQWYMDEMAIPALYFCADSDPSTAVTRLIAKRTGIEVEQVELGLEYSSGEEYLRALEGTQIHFCFDSAPTLGDVADEIAAYVEVWDRFPRLIVVDNLVNVESEMGEDFSGMRLIGRELHRLSRETGAAVLILHHMREVGDPRFPQPRSELQGKIAQLPERILSIAFDSEEGCLKLAVVKNRGGKADPTGKMFYRLKADPERATFSPWTGISRGGM